MIALLTDYGLHDPYVGMLKAVLSQHAAQVPVIDLLHQVPDFNPHAGAHLLAALAPGLPPGTVFLCVVDPGVGGPRPAVMLTADGRHFVGPDNGLLSVVAARATHLESWRIDWRPDALSASFHGRDLFAPVAARLAAGDLPPAWRVPAALEVQFDAADLARVIYLDHYGNAWTGIRGGLADTACTVEVGFAPGSEKTSAPPPEGARSILGRPVDRLERCAPGSEKTSAPPPEGARSILGRPVDRLEGVHALAWRRTFCEAGKGEAFWYVNGAGLVEIAVNRGSAAAQLGLRVGDPVRLAAAAESRWH